MAKAIYKGRVKDRYTDAVHLFYEYKGKEYIVTDEHNGYSEPMWVKHKNEQERIDRELEQAKQPSKPIRYEDTAQAGFDLFFDYVEGKTNV